MTDQTRRDGATWQIQEAKARFSEVVKRAREEGPQHVSMRGAPAVVVLSEGAYDALTTGRPSLVDHILDGPPWPNDLVDHINDRRRDGGP